MIKRLYRYIKYKICNKNIKLNINNKILENVFLEGNNYIEGSACISNAFLGKFSYIADGCDLHYAKIGRFTSIGPCVKIIRGQHPTKTFVSTCPAFYARKHPAVETFVQRDKFAQTKVLDESLDSVIIGNDVWIGANVLIIEGVKIHDGAIIAAGAVVTKDIPSYSVVAGVPAKILRYRFNSDEIDFLESLQWWSKDLDWIKEHADYFEDIKLLQNKIKRNHL